MINSVNYEDGDGPESRFAKVTALAREHGAALIALTIDEEGQARTAEKKVEIAERLIGDLTGNWGIRESDILIDTLTFTICTGQEESRRDGIATIEAIRELKRRHPQVQTTLGLSNISFGLNPAARILLNSVFLERSWPRCPWRSVSSGGSSTVRRTVWRATSTRRWSPSRPSTSSTTFSSTG